MREVVLVEPVHFDRSRGVAATDHGEAVGLSYRLEHANRSVGESLVFEDDRFADGTVGVLDAIAETACFSVVGGGVTSRAGAMYRLDAVDLSPVALAGGASIPSLLVQPLPAAELLQPDE